MMQKLSFVAVLKAVIDRVQKGTGLKCYDFLRGGETLPCYMAEIIAQRPDPSKTMWKEIYEVSIHVWAKGGSSVAIYDAIQKLEECLTEGIQLPEGYELVQQKPQGLVRLMEDEDESKHAVLGYEFLICYGYKIK